jgi:starvation-inducible outer membrane lipoprotein
MLMHLYIMYMKMKINIKTLQVGLSVNNSFLGGGDQLRNVLIVTFFVEPVTSSKVTVTFLGSLTNNELRDH